MMNVWNLLWIVPLAFVFGFCIGAIFGQGGDPYDN